MRSKVVPIVAIAVALLSIGIGRAVGANTVGSSDIVDFSIQSNDLATGAADKRVVAYHAVGNSELRYGAVDRRNIDPDALDSLQFYSIRSGVTVRGVIGGDYEVPTGTNCTDNCDFGAYASLPLPAPIGLSDSEVLVDNASWVTGDGQTKPDLDASESGSNAACTGSAQNPTAPAGKVCIYIAGGNNASAVKGVSVMPGTGTSRYGFKLVWSTTHDEDTFIDAVWAYKAP
jgi:hypothetical protein